MGVVDFALLVERREHCGEASPVREALLATHHRSAGVAADSVQAEQVIVETPAVEPLANGSTGRAPQDPFARLDVPDDNGVERHLVPDAKLGL